ncbi:hypothetical protein ABZ471_47730, partial [Streptomyces sp. NPDC005728]|uniref:nSTAND1 domain-containing NTPase n=1 Tax=Streptomyces sp. NPDC005728 TaxID=3157054 RepID=UPI0033DFFF7E
MPDPSASARHGHCPRARTSLTSERTWLIVDQFEELYTLCHDPDERDQFID